MAVSSRTAARRRRGAGPTRVRVLPKDRDRRAGDLDGLRIDGRELDLRVGDRLNSAGLSRTILGHSVLNVGLIDDDRQVLTSGVLGARAVSRVAELTVDGIEYSISGLSRASQILTLECEPGIVTVLKRDRGAKPVRVARGVMTRAQFCAMLIRAAGVPVLVLDEDRAQRIAGTRKLREELRKARGDVADRQDRDSDKRVRSSDLLIAKVDVAGKPLTKTQRRNAAKLRAVAEQENAPPRATLALFAGAIVEPAGYRGSGPFDSPNGGDRDSRGILQLRDSTASSIGISNRSVEACAREFLRNGFWRHRPKGAIELARANPGWTAGRIAQECQGSANPDRYDDVLPDARRVLRAAGAALESGDVDFGGTASGAAYVRQYAFERKRGESTYACCRRLLDEVSWRLFDREGVMVIASEPALARADPSLVLDPVEEGGTLVDEDWDVRRGQRVGHAQLTAWVGRYDADPGEVVETPSLTQAGDGEPWIIETSDVDFLVERPVAIAARLPVKPKAEPSSEVVTPAATGSESGSGSLEAGGSASDMYRACKQISEQGLPYIWGGGHARAGTPDDGASGTAKDSGPGRGYDCSGSVAAALVLIGRYRRGTPVGRSDGLGATLTPGQGKTWTVWANAEHIFIELKDGGAMKSFDTRRIGSSASGPRLRPALGPTAGFKPYH